MKLIGALSAMLLCACSSRAGYAPIPQDAQEHAVSLSLTPSMKEYALPTSQSRPATVAIGGDGNAWVVTTNAVDRVTPTGAITAFAAPSGVTFGGGTVRGSDGAIWTLGFDQHFGGLGISIYRIASTGAMKAARLPNRAQDFDIVAADLAAGVDGNLWYVVQGNLGCGGIGYVSTAFAFGAVSSFCEPNGIASNRRRAMSIAAPAQLSSRLALSTGGVVFITLFDRNDPGGISEVLQLTGTGSIVKTYFLPPGSDPQGIARGPNGTVWVTLDGLNQIARITASTGAIAYFIIPSPRALPAFTFSAASGISQIVSGGTSGMWFVENPANKIARITMTGAITEYRIPTPSSSPSGIAVLTTATGGSVWFAESATNKIAALRF